MRFFRILLAPLDFIMKYFKALVFLLIVFLIFAPSGEIQKPANLARIDLFGPIMESDTFLLELNKIEKEPKIKGVLLVIDSPGGALSPSVEISEAIKRLKSKMPVIAYAQGSMASGSYMAGMWANTIIANRGALLGSIGVILNGVDISELADKMGIKSQTIKAGIYKEAGTFMREWNTQERQMLENLLEEQYQMFVNDVKEARGAALKNQNFAEGRVFSAKSALEIGLIDEVGSLYEAQNQLIKLSGVKEPNWLEKDKIDLYLEKIVGSNLAKGIQKGIESAFSQFNQGF
ncbi:MAG: signal peptide peptidase SppA [Helicobacter sp.]|nr:signal peptide peptidase SppA [Helicobacter sp.]